MIRKTDPDSGRRGRDQPPKPKNSRNVIRTFVSVLENIDTRARPAGRKPKEGGR